MSSSKEDIHELAKEFMSKTKGSFSASDIVNLMLLDNLDTWMDLFKESLFSLDSNEYNNFVKIIINNSDKFTNSNINISKEIKETLHFY